MSQRRTTKLSANWETSMTEAFQNSLEEQSITSRNVSHTNANRIIDTINVANDINDDSNGNNNDNNGEHEAGLLAQYQPEEPQATEETLLPGNAAGLAADDEDAEVVCGVCLERPEPGNYVEVWCCGNVLCVNDAQQLGKCPFCRVEPLAWSIEK